MTQGFCVEFYPLRQQIPYERHLTFNSDSSDFPLPKLNSNDLISYLHYPSFPLKIGFNPQCGVPPGYLYAFEGKGYTEETFCDITSRRSSYSQPEVAKGLLTHPTGRRRP